MSTHSCHLSPGEVAGAIESAATGACQLRGAKEVRDMDAGPSHSRYVISYVPAFWNCPSPHRVRGLGSLS